MTAPYPACRRRVLASAGRPSELTAHEPSQPLVLPFAERPARPVSATASTRLRRYHEIAHVGEIARRYFAMNAFDGVLTTVGVLTGAFFGGVEGCPCRHRVVVGTRRQPWASRASTARICRAGRARRALRELEESTLVQTRRHRDRRGRPLRHRRHRLRRRLRRRRSAALIICCPSSSTAPAVSTPPTTSAGALPSSNSSCWACSSAACRASAWSLSGSSSWWPVASRSASACCSTWPGSDVMAKRSTHSDRAPAGATSRETPLRAGPARSSPLLAGLNEQQLEAVTHAEGRAADPRRRRLRQDAGAHAPRRLAHPRARRAPGRDPGHHVHEQGGRRDEGAHRDPGGSRGARHVDQHVPQHVRPAAAPRGGAAGLPAQLHHPRRRRQPPAHQALSRGARPRRQALPAGVHGARSSATPRTACRIPPTTARRSPASSPRPPPTSTTSTRRSSCR